MRQLPAGLLLALLAVGPPLAAVEADAGLAGRSLTDALLELRRQGLKLIFTSRIVDPAAVVADEPSAGEPRTVLDELLAPHGLEARAGPGNTLVVLRRPAAVSTAASAIHGLVLSRRGLTPVPGVEIQLKGTDRQTETDAEGTFLLSVAATDGLTLEARHREFVIKQLEQILLAPGETTRMTIVLDPAPVTEEDLLVMPSQVSLLRQAPAAPIALSRNDVLALPHLGDDFFRALSLLPGVSSNDVSAEFHLRGGRRGETQILLDGQELYETYHLKDFDNAISVVAPSTLASVDLSTGGFSARHGDRMSGVLDMTTLRPSGPRRSQVGLSIFNASVGSASSLGKDRGSWMAQLRRGSLDLAERLVSQEENPSYWDAFGRLDYQLGRQSSLRANLLLSDDELEFIDDNEDGSKNLETQYSTGYLWLTHQQLLGPRAFLETAISRSEIDRNRRGAELEEDVEFEIADVRDLEVQGFRQEWNFQLTPDQLLRFGYELRDFDAGYDYASAFTFDNPLAVVRADPDAEATVFRQRFAARHNNAYLSHRLPLGKPGLVELGLRYDQHSLTDEELWSPRLNLVLALGTQTLLRGAWGRFNQSQRLYELQVEDGETSFHRVEKAEHQLLGVEHRFDAADGSPGAALRVELYRRQLSNPLPRYENLYEPINIFPELEPDRVRVAPEQSLAEGIEMFFRARPGQKISWWANYAYATTDDLIDGRHVPRRFDQTHAFNLDLDYRLGPVWTLNLAWRFHTGWPTTPLTVEQRIADDEEEDGDGDGTSTTIFVPVLGAPFSSRLSDYHRLDLRARRQWRRDWGTVQLFIDVQNLYNRQNPSGFDYEVDEETGTILPNPEHWAGILPSIGVNFEF